MAKRFNCQLVQSCFFLVFVKIALASYALEVRLGTSSFASSVNLSLAWTSNVSLCCDSFCFFVSTDGTSIDNSAILCTSSWLCYCAVIPLVCTLNLFTTNLANKKVVFCCNLFYNVFVSTLWLECVIPGYVATNSTSSCLSTVDAIDNPLAIGVAELGDFLCFYLAADTTGYCLRTCLIACCLVYHFDSVSIPIVVTQRTIQITCCKCAKHTYNKHQNN